MTQEEKNLLIKEMCARMPYGVYFKCGGYATTKLTSIHNAYSEYSSGYILNGFFRISDNTRIFLRDYGTMTEEEIAEYEKIDQERQGCGNVFIDFLHSHHFDNRDMAGKGLAIIVKANGSKDYDRACRMWNGVIESKEDRIMITEDYVSFELAQLLKENNFNEPCNSRFYKRTPECKPEVFHTSIMEDFNRSELRNTWSRPTHQMAMKWLRDVLQIDAEIRVEKSKPFGKRYVRWVSKGDYMQRIDSIGFEKYEEAVEETLKYILVRLNYESN